jgi:hypothetical protein
LLRVTFVLDSKSHAIDAVLSPQLENLHLLVDFHITVLPPHASVKQFVEENVPLIRLDSHFEHLFLGFPVVKLIYVEA